MRKLFFFPLLLFILLSIWVVAPAAPAQAAACYPLPAGLTGRWPGDGNPNDVAGGRHALLRGDATTGPGLVGQAFALDGEGDFIEVAHDPALNLGTGDFTISLWARFNNASVREQVLIEKWIQRYSAGSQGWTLTKLSNNSLRLAMSPGTTDTNVDSPPLTLPNNTWIHFAATRRAGEVTLYVNGRVVASGSFAGSFNSAASLKFGHRGSPADTPGSEDERGFFLGGAIDEVQYLAGMALSEDQLMAQVAAGSAGPCKDAERPDSSVAPWLRAHPVWDSVDGWNWPEEATLRLTIDDPATPAAPDLAMDMPGQIAPALGSVWFGFGGVYDLKAGDRVTLSDGTTTRELVVAALTIDTIDVAAGTVSGTAMAGASVRLPDPPPPDRALFVTAGGDGKWLADFRKAGFTLSPGKMVIAEVHEEDGDLTSFAWEIPALARTIHRPVAEFLYPNVTGAFIELQAEPLRPWLWTRVQWQDAAGGWHDIEGWQGAFNPDQRVLWYVGEDHLGRGPFRWLVYAEQGGELVGASASFNLPARGQLLHVKVTLDG